MGVKKGIILSIFLVLTACSDGKTTEFQDQTSSEQTGLSNETQTLKSEKGENDREATVPAKDDFDFQDEDKNVLSKMEASISYTQEEERLNFIFQVTNNAKHPFTFHFDTMQQYAYTIRKADGEVVKQLKNESDKKLPSTAFLKPGGAAIYDFSVKKLPLGSYTINLVFLSKELGLKKSFDFSVE
ncbi:BsuPI-related putative proteinase inhibitor [Niallia sp.]|uniref:BsuPI-related putative proteinase inhibitor n=1 Tax=Niallia sp. TaxID=2837523 RepID=UPI00289D2342|nr:BsuPI-related putative proteinase inhibitor [Niallia sp.]